MNPEWCDATFEDLGDDQWVSSYQIEDPMNQTHCTNLKEMHAIWRERMLQDER